MSILSGSPSESRLTGYTPIMKSPGYDFSSIFYDYLQKSMLGKPMPAYSGPTASQFGFRSGPNFGGRMKEMFRIGDRYMDTGMPTIFGQATGSLGRFLAPSFANPIARLQMGAPNYFGEQALPPLLINPAQAPNG